VCLGLLFELSLIITGLFNPSIVSAFFFFFFLFFFSEFCYYYAGVFFFSFGARTGDIAIPLVVK
jgi:hypothetical protein